MSLLTHGGDITDQLKTLGTGSMEQPGAPHAGHLEVFPNRCPTRPYVVSLSYPEYTSLCPVTGQPDFGVIVVDYIPGALCVESKSFKLYLFAFRNHQAFMETLTNKILDDMVSALSPRWCRVKGLFAPRGATHIHVFAEYMQDFAEDDKDLARSIRRMVRDWKREAAPHSSPC